MNTTLQHDTAEILAAVEHILAGGHPGSDTHHDDDLYLPSTLVADGGGSPGGTYC